MQEYLTLTSQEYTYSHNSIVGPKILKVLLSKIICDWMYDHIIHIMAIF